MMSAFSNMRYLIEGTPINCQRILENRVVELFLNNLQAK